jgi:hypothetical protein
LCHLFRSSGTVVFAFRKTGAGAAQQSSGFLQIAAEPSLTLEFGFTYLVELRSKL